MKLEGIITCVNYDDFLSETLPLNKGMFDRLIVVTTPEDIKTQKICEYWHVECIKTSIFGVKGEFRKGAAINIGLQHLKRDGWVLHLDADIVLPPQTRIILQQIPLDKTMIYGTDRFNLTGNKTWRKHKRQPKLLHENWVYVHAGAYPMATRFMWCELGGYLPIGYFQLWNPKESNVYTYPIDHTTAARTDVLFAQQWSREKRGFLPEFVVYHLESEKRPNGANWKGRTTIRFERAGIVGWFQRLIRKMINWVMNLIRRIFNITSDPYVYLSKQEKK